MPLFALLHKDNRQPAANRFRRRRVLHQQAESHLILPLG